jgi:hypothetical protein
MEESIKGTAANGTAHVHLRGLDMKNVEPGLLGLGRTDPFFEISKKNADYAAGVVVWYDPDRAVCTAVLRLAGLKSRVLSCAHSRRRHSSFLFSLSPGKICQQRHERTRTLRLMLGVACTGRSTFGTT